MSVDGRRKLEEASRLTEVRNERAAAALVRENKAAEKSSLKKGLDDEKAKQVDTANTQESKDIAPSLIVYDARWAKSLKPDELKNELKARNQSIQGSKKDLLSRLVACL